MVTEKYHIISLQKSAPSVSGYIVVQVLAEPAPATSQDATSQVGAMLR
jgi:hypothetical protein